MVVPVDVEVTSREGLFSTVDNIDFGFVRRQPSEYRVANLYVISTLSHTLEIKDGGGVTVEPQSPAVSLQFEEAGLRPIPKAPADGSPPTPVSIAKVSFFPDKVTHVGDAPYKESGKIVVKSKGGKYKLSVGYSAIVYGGDVEHNPADTSFYAGHSPPLNRNVSIINRFPFALAIYNVSVPRVARPSFRAHLLPDAGGDAVILRAGESKMVLNILYHKQLAAPFHTFVRLSTNASKLDLPVYIFEGKLKVTLSSIDQSRFNFGTLDSGDRRSIQMAVTNENPVAVSLRHVRNSAEKTFSSIRLVGVEAGNGTLLSSASGSLFELEWEPGKDFLVPANSFAVFEYSVVAPVDRAVYHNTVIFQSPYETLYFPVHFQVEPGAIVSIPEKIVFKNAFPGKISSQPLQIYSTFELDMPLLRLSTLTRDPRIVFETFDRDQPSPVIKNGIMSYLGRVFFYPGANCHEDCYVGLPLHTNDGAWFVYGMRLPPNLPEIDAYLYQRLKRKWDQIVSKSQHLVNSTVVVDTTAVKQFQIPTEAQLVWPRLLRQSSVHFPLTAVGNFTIVNLTIQNPSDRPVVIQILPLTIYPDPEGVVHFFKDELASPLTENVEMNETLMFTLRDTELFNLRPDSPVPKLREQLEKVVGQTVPRFTLSMLLQPGMKVRIRVGFLPTDYALRSSLLLIRNNLTVLEPVVLYGRGATVELRVGNRLPKATQPLLFEIQDRHLTDCQNPKRLTHQLMTTLTVRRSFMARNSGEVPLHITNVSVNGVPCENHGFKLLNCRPFRLRPNESHMLEVAYTPDFTMSWNQASLQLYVQGNGSALVYPLAASIPNEWLPRCQRALPRPQWEPIMYYSCVTALVFLCVCIVASAYLEGDRAVTVAWRQRRRRQRRVFDLNAVNEPEDDDDRTTTSDDAALDVTAYLTAITNALLWLFSVLSSVVVSGVRSSHPAKIEVEKKVAEEKSATLNKSQSSTSDMNKSGESGGATALTTKQQQLLAANHDSLTRKSSMEDGNQSSGQITQQKGKTKQKRKEAKGRQRNTYVSSAIPPEPTVSKNSGLPENYPSVSDTWEVVVVKKEKSSARYGSDRETKGDDETKTPPPAQNTQNRGAKGNRSDAEGGASKDASSGAARRAAWGGGGAEQPMTPRRRSEDSTTSVGGDDGVPTDPYASPPPPPPSTSVEPQPPIPPSTTHVAAAGAYAASQRGGAHRAVSASESEESTVPEWDVAPLPDSQSYDVDFAQLASQTESFATSGGDAARGQQQKKKKAVVAKVDVSSSSSASDHSTIPPTLSRSDESSSGSPPPSSSRRTANKQMKADSALSGGIAAAVTAAHTNSQQALQHGGRKTAPGMTLMEQLHSERQQRLTEYRHKNPFGKVATTADDWPGLTQLPSLWDKEKEPWRAESEVWGSPPKCGDGVSAAVGAELLAAAPGGRAASLMPKIVKPNNRKKKTTDELRSSGGETATAHHAAAFRLNPAAAPFVSSKIKKQLHRRSPQSSPRQRSKMTLPPPKESAAEWEPSIGAEEPTRSTRLRQPRPPLFETPNKANTEGALGLTGGLFSSMDFDIWKPVVAETTGQDPAVSWAEALLASDDDQQWKDAEDDGGGKR